MVRKHERREREKKRFIFHVKAFYMSTIMDRVQIRKHIIINAYVEFN